MLLALVFILLLVWAAVVGSLYSNFIVFYKSFAEVDSYNKAYYASIAALERGELVTKQREPGYVWSGWWRWVDEININDKDKVENFSYLVKSDDTNLLRDVNSRASRIPREWEWDVDWMLATWNSLNYNKMDYEDAEVFLLYYDKWNGSPYQKKSCSNPTDCEDSKAIIEWEIRLPPKLKETFGWGLDTNSWLIVWWNKDDEIVDWQLRWNYNGNQFTIFARNKGVVSGSLSEKDSVIRESNINEGVSLNFWSNTYKWQPNAKKFSPSPLIIISEDDSLNPSNFSDVLNPVGLSSYTWLSLRLSLLNLLKTTSKMIYPYLEYYLSFTNDVADKYFRIDGEWRYKDYQVDIIMYKPTVKESVLWNFTVIF